MKKRIWHLSDVHELENLIDIPSNNDIFIFSGDCTLLQKI